MFNIDGTPNQAGSINDFACLAMTVDGHKHWVDVLITNLGGEDLILGLPWLRRLNPAIDWSTGCLLLRSKPVTVKEIPDHKGRAIGGTTTGDQIIEDSRLDGIPAEAVTTAEHQQETPITRDFV